MRWQHRDIVKAAALLVVSALGSAGGQGLPPQADLARSPGSPAGRVAVTAGEKEARFDVRPESWGASLRLAFRQPLATAAKERLLLEGRSTEHSGQGLYVARLILLDARGAAAATYEPDIILPPPGWTIPMPSTAPWTAAIPGPAWTRSRS